MTSSHTVHMSFPQSSCMTVNYVDTKANSGMGTGTHKQMINWQVGAYWLLCRIMCRQIRTPGDSSRACRGVLECFPVSLRSQAISVVIRHGAVHRQDWST